MILIKISMVEIEKSLEIEGTRESIISEYRDVLFEFDGEICFAHDKENKFSVMTATNKKAKVAVVAKRCTYQKRSDKFNLDTAVSICTQRLVKEIKKLK